MKILKYAAICSAVALSAQSKADISWSSTGSITESDGITELIGNAFNSAAGYFVQLIFAGPDGIANPAVSSGVGTSGDDLVVSARWIGAGDFVSPNGSFTAGSPWTGPQEVSGSKFFVRAWNAPSPSFNNTDLAASLVPTTATNYGNSGLFTSPGRDITQPPDGIPDIQAFDAGAFSTSLTPVAVPEPGTLGLIAMGTFGMWLFRRRKAAVIEE